MKPAREAMNKIILFLKKLFLVATMVVMRKQWLRPVMNVGGGELKGSKKSALLIYLSTPFHLRPKHPLFWLHQNQRQCLIIAEILQNLGYIVDVADITDRNFTPRKTYDLVISHRVNHTGLEKAIGPKTIKIYLASGTNHRVRNRRVQKRLQDLRARRGCKLSPIVQDEEYMPYLHIADELIGFGNKRVMETWRQNFSGMSYPFNNYGIFNRTNIKRNFKEARNNFLFFGSRQQVAKGLDLLLEVFSKLPNHNLHVCSAYAAEKDFCNCYKEELFRTENIHAHGFVDIRGSVFRELLNICAFVIHPSASEGSPGSVIHAVSAGLVPILSKESGVDVDGFGFLLKDARLNTISKTVQKLATLKTADLLRLSARARKAGRTHFSETAFRKRLTQILKTIFNKHKSRGK